MPSWDDVMPFECNKYTSFGEFMNIEHNVKQKAIMDLNNDFFYQGNMCEFVNLSYDPSCKWVIVSRSHNMKSICSSLSHHGRL